MDPGSCRQSHSSSGAKDDVEFFISYIELASKSCKRLLQKLKPPILTQLRTSLSLYVSN